MKRLGLLVIVLYVLVTVSCNLPVSSAEEIKPTVVSPTVTLETLEATPTVQATVVREPTIAATPAPKVNPYIFDAGDFDLDISTGSFSLRFDEGALAKVEEISAQLISPLNTGDYENTSEGLSLGTGIGVSRADNYGNILLGFHSGYYKDTPLQAEPLRFYFEQWGASDKAVLDKLGRALGSNGVLKVDGIEVNVSVVAAIRVDSAAATEIQLYPEKVLDIVTDEKYAVIGDRIPFDIAKNNKHGIMLNFCGWGPDNNYSYFRYVVLLDVLEMPQTP
ncbi:hypothetical protein A2380_02725 [candidate division WWE3 bacterium RIFOXYB1_FULL_43_24]|uniref:Uncharacterized protein n=1 Tax=candidate division WWE3 bacterium GW2011_GWF1_42_14 TaxID=1619138 RepID=A0A0G0YNW2_UNCKA|nr:MAG: hypothetical protein UU92_C0007G0070 [candidate division WWE3 bacterium GW2011_GWA1_42_12]KKS38422.1 MAG: hypothetical protein UV00_C0007G0003 [candidate division WWE3 bacterium GW2011_GWF1_42_14]KKS39648.1 MAG: hypothetical protein UV03_C0025G0003 [candidate division WWE3 bacterium GW2011_GWE1_42_16]OGC58633.1 MAG: hypothetical protein A2212_02000 [candidate division WWE3 bacterium RIFOXYA1_FULL_42_9]OGC69019.1 MAG: hypothetical protein A2380_02725 [candidate division WWE3 bacterium RI